MQLKSLFYLVSALSVTLVRATASDILSGITTIGVRVNALQQAVAYLPQTGGSIALAIDTHNKATATIDAIEGVTTIAKDLEGEVTADVGAQALNAFHMMAPVIHNSVQTIIAKKDAIASLPVGGATAVVRLDLLGLHSAAIDLQNVLLGLTPADHKDEANALALEINTSLNNGIEAYSDNSYSA